ncbi:2-dehydro-3-deoxy-6-phosphogalactonate aldolase [Hoeflea prorocentri]|uniref:2-dehydro-3-deoxy-6-phosphogalactonate aldolase n=1 Tax=Hoeflea prorocentri TaxID=1922333 RepID=A0A9X3UKJ4_9HYPH|nr:2-dehydro-3-deoxy-6-phosphogalactonate aldolase [Hoeflea prorocentri]MCY6382237.1 2-dehydro-3-deoxy-6-phosphogalactonate aldolase [Hoeflea prorocentri]MDA5400037.1 2-dehydro-3-deoxy-6-phosphogalactonate aldolase [Hoeflea prorocentri]
MTNTIPWPSLKRSLVAILRGLKPEETAEAVQALVDAGFEAIEIPLNSPEPFTSIKIAVDAAPAGCLIGAGTVLELADVERLAEAGGRLMVSPNVDPAVIRAASDCQMVTMPGVFTPTEALSAVKAGASGLKFFPASILGPSGITAIRAVLPAHVEIGAVGGVSHENYESYREAGIRTFGLGSSLYKPGMDTAEIARRARLSVETYDAVFGA